MSFTIRNKAAFPILTLSPALFEKMLAARPEASSLALTKYMQDYRSLTGKTITLTYEQNIALLTRYNADEAGQWTSSFSNHPKHKVISCFTEGFLRQTISSGFEADLAVAEDFYELLEENHK